MNRLRNIFQDTNLDKIPNHIWDENYPICWYPSSGYDFRHIFYWDSLRRNRSVKFPKIFIHTDFTCLNHNPYPKECMDIGSRMLTEKNIKEGKPAPHPLLYDGYILDIFGDGNRLSIKNWTELFLKEDVFYPNKELFFFANQLKDRTHKVYAINCQLINLEKDFYSLRKGDTFKTLDGERHQVEELLDVENLGIKAKDSQHKIPLNSCDFENPDNDLVIFVFTMENSNFFFDVVLRNNLRIDYLTHINDGGGTMGGSITKMDFIYLYSETLGITKMVIDDSLENKKCLFRQWTDHYYYNPKVERESFIEKTPEIDLNNWKEQEVYFPTSKGIYIKNKWGTGNHKWKYSYFNNELAAVMPNKSECTKQYENYFYYEKKFLG